MTKGLHKCRDFALGPKYQSLVIDELKQLSLNRDSLFTSVQKHKLHKRELLNLPAFVSALNLSYA